MKQEIKLYDIIGDWGVTAKDLTEQIAADTTEIVLRINSPGGAVADGLAMYNYLRDHPAHITAIVDGYAASAASVVMLAGDEVHVHESSIVMLHNPWGMAVGNAKEMRKTADVLDLLGQALLDIYKAKTGMSDDDLRRMIDDESWMRGAAAVDYGFADVLIEDENRSGEEQAAAHVAFAAMLARINEGEEIVSRQKTRKEIEAEAAEAQAALDTVNAQLAQAKEEQAVAVAAVQSDADKRIAAVEARSVEMQAKIEEMQAALDAAAKTATELRAALDAEASARGQLEADLDAAKAALRNPAVADAIIGEMEGSVVPVDAEADAAESAAAADSDESATPHYDAYRLLRDAGEARKATAYWREHATEITDEMKALAQQDG